MGLTLVLAAALGWGLDKGFCPLAPSPEHYLDNVAVRVENGRMTNEALSARVAARLVDTSKAGASGTIGWLYLDEEGTRYVILKSSVRRDIYAALHVNPASVRRSDPYSEITVQLPYQRLPTRVEVHSCTQPD